MVPTDLVIQGKYLDDHFSELADLGELDNLPVLTAVFRNNPANNWLNKSLSDRWLNPDLDLLCFTEDFPQHVKKQTNKIDVKSILDISTSSFIIVDLSS